MMTPFLGELIGTCILVVLGDGIVANVLLNKTKGHGSGWIAITLGWSMAVFVAVYSVAAVSGAHINPAASIALAAAGKFPWADVPLYVAGQMIGAMIGALIVWISYRQHFEETLDGDAKLAVFCTGPAIRSPLNNLASEIIGTFILIFGILSMVSPQSSLGSLDALPAALLVLGIGLSLGGTTGFAINPARDLGPRIMHAILPISNKRDSDWGYSYIPVVGPIVGGLLASFVHGLL
ncbi:MAG: Glycerol uptake facilitator protein [Nitrosomonadaceae bacterium]|jgi:glycerol uptake facilitator protein|nr:Glycerol uptake facilitator protein [Nitrosomonadaceae bacterium]MDW7564790.1 MIP/aquaporin family protein [Nitrosomonadaceae bacterium]MDW7598338.1 MIP/aquaporin family protein [Nitrosomonadaceae bacterium]MDW7619538.1 MIP/aquaporin family protein [Nitrosomonadaceae bacterium]MDW7647804.1 MIP/aquaporin family protein [Nitrosomonadaceae bacterium]